MKRLWASNWKIQTSFSQKQRVQVPQRSNFTQILRVSYLENTTNETYLVSKDIESSTHYHWWRLWDIKRSKPHKILLTYYNFKFPFHVFIFRCNLCSHFSILVIPYFVCMYMKIPYRVHIHALFYFYSFGGVTDYFILFLNVYQTLYRVGLLFIFKKFYI